MSGMEKILSWGRGQHLFYGGSSPEREGRVLYALQGASGRSDALLRKHHHSFLPPFAQETLAAPVCPYTLHSAPLSRRPSCTWGTSSSSSCARSHHSRLRRLA